ncbi:MAG: 4a-hydroxytetrahydrobiopterin dehydratase [Marinilabiliales bacterium]|nr:MAG: 4a-hydroxytetrahydrobiopterin dehydratase [Marinilabiliales bacterium]
MEPWQETKNGLVKVFKLRNFLKAIDFVNDVAKIAEAQKHHPDILLHSYNQVKITSITHEEGEITCKDYDLAKEIDLLLQK